MAKTPSNMLALGTIAPDFSLPDTLSGETKSLSELKSPIATVVLFICNHCPYVLHINDTLVQLTNDYISKGISFIAISSNDASQYPEDNPDKMKSHGMELGYRFPYLYDETQIVAKAYNAACTPDIFVFDKDLKLAYRGQFDASRPGNQVPCDGGDLKKALDCLIDSRPINFTQKPSLGCNIKWKDS